MDYFIDSQKKKISKDDVILAICMAIAFISVIAVMFYYRTNTSEHIKSYLNNNGVQVNDATFTKTNNPHVYKSSEPLLCEDGTVYEYWQVWFSQQAGLLISVSPYDGDISKIVDK